MQFPRQEHHGDVVNAAYVGSFRWQACSEWCWDRLTEFHVGFADLAGTNWTQKSWTRFPHHHLDDAVGGAFCVDSGRSRRGAVLVRLRTWSFSGVWCLDGVSIALLSQEELALESEFLLFGFRGHNGVEVGFSALLLGSKDSTEPLGFFLS